MGKQQNYAHLDPYIPGSSYKQIFDMLHKVALLRYVNESHLRALNPKQGTKGKTEKWVELSYLDQILPGVYTITRLTYLTLRDEKYQLEYIQQKFRAKTAEHSLKISSVLVDMMSQEDFFYVFYPSFSDPDDKTREIVKPDACVIFKRDNLAKLLFLEVEDSIKPPGYLEKKARGYEKISHSIETYHWWKGVCDKLGFEYCEVKDFCFSIKLFKNGEERSFINGLAQ